MSITQVPPYNMPQQAPVVQAPQTSPLVEALLARSMNSPDMSRNSWASALPSLSEMMRWKREWDHQDQPPSGSDAAAKATQDAGGGIFGKIASFLGLGGGDTPAPSYGGGFGDTATNFGGLGAPQQPMFNTDTITPS